MIQATNVDHSGKMRNIKTLQIKDGCDFPFKCKGHQYDGECVKNTIGDWCATSKTKNGYTKTWAFCKKKKTKTIKIKKKKNCTKKNLMSPHNKKILKKKKTKKIIKIKDKKMSQHHTIAQESEQKEIFINDLIIRELDILRKNELNQKKFFKARPYKAVIDAINEDYKDKIVTNGEDFRKYKGVGDKMIKKINEIIQNGYLDAAERIRKDTDNEIINNIQERVYGIGAVKAKELVKEYNIKSIDDLIKRQYEKMDNDRDLLNDVQKKGLKYYNDIKKKIPRTEMVKHDSYLRSIGKEIDKDLKVMIVGSYRRGVEKSGDIDILLKDKNDDEKVLKKFIDLLTRKGYLIDQFGFGKKKFNGMSRLINSDLPARRVDVLFTTKKEYPFALFYFTGSGSFNPKFRQLAIEKGYRLSEHGIDKLDKKKNKVIEKLNTDTIESEEDIFKFFDVPYIEPENRNPRYLGEVLKKKSQ